MRMCRGLAFWTLIGAWLPLAPSCKTQFDFDVPVSQELAGASGTVAGAAGDAAGTANTGGADHGSGTAAFPNIGECTYHCAEHGLVCAQEWLRCGECNADGDCNRAGRRRCDVVLHRCFECGTNTDCAEGAVCEPTSRRCVPQCGEVAGAGEGGAGDDLACPSGMTCNMSVGRCAGCSTDANCASSSAGSRCQLSMQQCVACLVDADCGGSTPHCDPVEMSCVGCRDSSDCGSEHCEPVHHVCL